MGLRVRNVTGFKFFVLLEKTDSSKYTLHISKKPISTKRVYVVCACPLMHNKSLIVPSSELDPNSALTVTRHDFDSAKIISAKDEENNLIITVYAKS